MRIDDIISYHELVAAEKANLQKGMNFGIGRGYSVVLMSVRAGAPYADAIDPGTGMLTYEGHDINRNKEFPNPKVVISPLPHREARGQRMGSSFARRWITKVACARDRSW
jgi:hypothetical protein